MKIKSENYASIQGWMRTDLDLKGNELLVYAVIYGFSQDGENYFTGSAQYVADWCGITKRAALDILKKLSEKGVIEKKEITENSVKFCHYRCKIFAGVVKKLHQGDEESSPGGGEKTSPYNKDIHTKEDKINKINKEIIEQEFERLWADYPRKQGKEAALKAYARLRSKEDYGKFNEYTVLEGIKRYTEYIQRNKIMPKYIKQGSTWFNQHCWEDDYNLETGRRKYSSQEEDFIKELEDM